MNLEEEKKEEKKGKEERRYEKLDLRYRCVDDKYLDVYFASGFD